MPKNYRIKEWHEVKEAYILKYTDKSRNQTNLKPNGRQQAAGRLFLVVVVPDTVQSFPATLSLFGSEILFFLSAVAVTVPTVAVTVTTVAMTVSTVAVTVTSMAVSMVMVMMAILTTSNYVK